MIILCIYSIFIVAKCVCMLAFEMFLGSWMVLSAHYDYLQADVSNGIYRNTINEHLKCFGA